MSTTEAKHTPGQINLTYKSADHMRSPACSAEIARAFVAGGRVYLERAGYAGSQYAMLNVERVNPRSGERYHVDFENNGLPLSWVNFLGGMIAKISQHATIAKATGEAK